MISARLSLMALLATSPPRGWANNKLVTVGRAAEFRAAHRLHETVAKALSRKLAESENAYLAEVLMSGKTGVRLERLAAGLEDDLSGAVRLQAAALSGSGYGNFGTRLSFIK